MAFVLCLHLNVEGSDQSDRGPRRWAQSWHCIHVDPVVVWFCFKSTTGPTDLRLLNLPINVSCPNPRDEGKDEQVFYLMLVCCSNCKPLGEHDTQFTTQLSSTGQSAALQQQHWLRKLTTISKWQGTTKDNVDLGRKSKV